MFYFIHIDCLYILYLSDFRKQKIFSPPFSSREFSEVSSMRMNRPPKVLHPTLAFHEQRWKTKEEPSSNVLLPGFQCPSFYNTLAVMEDGVTMRSFSDTSFEKNYVVLFFFPMDRSVDYSELMAFKGNLEVFAKNECQVVGVTSDSVITIENWIKLEPNKGGTGGPVNFPIISDKTMDVAKMFGVKRPSGMPARATFILDKNRIIRHSSVYPMAMGRSVEEVLKTVQAIKEIDQAGEEYDGVKEVEIFGVMDRWPLTLLLSMKPHNLQAGDILIINGEITFVVKSSSLSFTVSPVVTVASGDTFLMYPAADDAMGDIKELAEYLGFVSEGKVPIILEKKALGDQS